jgi:hypothetical protein
MLNDEIRKIINYTKGSKIKKIVIKRIKVKIDIKNKLEATITFLLKD